MSTDPRARQQRRFARDVAVRRISGWTAALAVGSVLGSGAVAVVARAATESAAGSGSTSGATGVSSNDGSQTDQGNSGDDSGGLQPPQDAPVPQQQQGPALGSSGGS